MAANGKSSQRFDEAKANRIFFNAIVGVPSCVVLLHLLWPNIVWLRALACGLIIVPVELLLTFIAVRVTVGKGSILNGLTIILPIIAGVSSVKYGWAATLWTLGVLVGVHLTGTLYFWVNKNFVNHHE